MRTLRRRLSLYALGNLILLGIGAYLLVRYNATSHAEVVVDGEEPWLPEWIAGECGAISGR